MSVAAFQHIVPWTEEEYLQLGETPDRVELFDGSLFVSPSPTADHQRLARRLANALDDPAEAIGCEVLDAINVRLARGRIPIPDLVVVNQFEGDRSVLDAADVRLIGEIVSPSNAATDRVLKMHYYAEAGIPWYLLVEPSPELVLRLFRLDGTGYVKHAEGRPGQPLVLAEPVVAVLDPDALLRRPGGAHPGSRRG